MSNYHKTKQASLTKESSLESFTNQSKFIPSIFNLDSVEKSHEQAIKIVPNQSLLRKRNKYEKLISLNQQLFQRKTQQLKITQLCEEKQHLYEQLLKNIQRKKLEQEIRAKNYLIRKGKKQRIRDFQNQLSQMKNTTLKLEASYEQNIKQFKKEIQPLINQQSQLQNIKEQKQKKKEEQEDTYFINFLKEKLQKKKNELYQIQVEEKHINNDGSSNKFFQLKNSIHAKKDVCLQLKEEKETVKKSIKKIKKKQFQMQQGQHKQDRVNNDIKEQIETINGKIKKQVIIDQKLRIQLMRKIEDVQAKKTHPKDLPYEDLRKLKEYNHQLKVRLLQIKENYEKQKEEPEEENRVSIQKVQDIKKKIKKQSNLYEKIRNTPKENEAMLDNIKKFERRKEKIEKRKHEQFTQLEEDIEKKQTELIDLKATVKVLKKEMDHVRNRLKEYQECYPDFTLKQKEKKIRKEKNKTKIDENTAIQLTKKSWKKSVNHEQREFEQKEEANTVKLPSKSGTDEDSKKKKTKKATKTEEIPILTKNDKQYDTVYIHKPRKWGEFWFVIIALCMGIIYCSFKKQLGL